MSKKVLIAVCFLLWSIAASPQVLSVQPHFTAARSVQQTQRKNLDELLRQNEHRNDINAAQVLAEIAVKYIEFDSKYAVDIAERAELLVTNATLSSDRVHILNSLAYVYRADGRYKQSSECFLRALGMAKGIEDNNEIVGALLGLGFVNGYLGKYDEELGYYLEAFPFAERSGNRRTLVLALCRLASGTYYSQKNYTRADSLYNEALKHCRDADDDDLRAQIYTSSANFYRFLKQPERQLQNYRRALEIHLRLGNSRSIGRASSNLGWIFTQQGQLDSAIFYMNQCIRLYEETKYAGGLGNAFTTLAEAQNKLGLHKEAIVSAHRALSFSIPLGEKPDQSAAYRNLSVSYAVLGEYKSAWEAEKYFTALKDSMYNDGVAKKLTELEAVQKEQKIQLLQSDKARQDVIRNFLITGLGAALVYAITLIYTNRRKRLINTELQRQQMLLEVQAVEIETSNVNLQELNQQLESQNQELVDYNNEKNEILGIVAHDLKNPIAAIRGLAELLSAGFVEPQQTREITEQISMTADRMLELVKNLLDINRLESGGMQFESVKFNIAPLVEGTIGQYKTYAEAKNITLHYAAEALSSIVFADEQAMIQVLDNLISNAVKYSPHGKNVFVRIASGLDAVRVEVQDEGQGISDEDKKKLFGKFARLSARPTGGEHSTGLGLSIVKRMVEAMDGRVWCESELGKGATFIVELPMSSNTRNSTAIIEET